MALTQVQAGMVGQLSPSNLDTQAQYTGFKNRIINGGMRIDQRNAGASVTPVDGQYGLDRWKAFISASSKFSFQQNAGSVTPPAGFTNYLGCTSISAYSVGANDYFLVQQNIEGVNFSDMAWGTANAQLVTLSFWARSSLTGTFGGALVNSDNNRGYAFSYTINTANTWEYKTITIAGDTTGTWLTTNGTAVQVRFSLGAGTNYSGAAGAWTANNRVSATGATSVVGTNGATFYITGVQLEKGSTATSFDYRPYGTELALCQRYYFSSSRNASNDVIFPYLNGNNLTARASFAMQMRTTPTVTIYSGATPNVVSQVGGSNQAVSGVGGVSETGFRTINGSTFSSSPYPFFEFNYNASAEL